MSQVITKRSQCFAQALSEGLDARRQRGAGRPAAAGEHVQLAGHRLRRAKRGRVARRRSRAASSSGSTATAFPSATGSRAETGRDSD